MHVTGRLESYLDYLGGVVGYLYGAIEDSSAIAEVTSTSGYSAGGLVGYLDGGSVKRSYADGFVFADTGIAGGLVGSLSDGAVDNSYALSTVTGGTSGGLVATLSGSSSVISGFAAGEVTGAYSAGGLIAVIYSGFDAGSFWDTEATGLATSAGTAGGYTTAQMLSSTGAVSDAFALWDSAIWDFGTTSQYPALINVPGGVAAQR